MSHIQAKTMISGNCFFFEVKMLKSGVRGYIQNISCVGVSMFSFCHVMSHLMRKGTLALCSSRSFCNGNRYINHFYNLAVEAGFYGDAGRVVGSFTKLSNIDSVSTWMGDQLLDCVDDPSKTTLQTHMFSHSKGAQMELPLKLPLVP